MEIPDSVIPPASAVVGRDYTIAFADDDWHFWDHIDQALLYRGRRSPNGRWDITSLDGEDVEWDYADDEIVVIA
ncbi:hypothetical protein H7J07_04805 [Mycobacterium koreense]|uniref:Uncharacterized protein n=1 Tax=Mycolicibacillus koreensis TaxID=1069220 RepID=A0A7I7SCW6_9MYCO|nr:hypothetical protein [Mycolicibacillus koreensis]MCV7247577.1 hypothetical protein [Mycolicibacillus koreensis]OSC32842.1 hypothetical protein B8W67_14080 [Mycolicibacillus koreensis]BBY53956.1 hypothetical protein MKOR_12070 [Mycolicibacillus koreensis]